MEGKGSRGLRAGQIRGFHSRLGEPLGPRTSTQLHGCRVEIITLPSQGWCETETIYETQLAQRRSPINVSSPSPASHVLPTLALKLLNQTLLMLRGRDLRRPSNRPTGFRSWREGESLGGVGASVGLREGGLAPARKQRVGSRTSEERPSLPSSLEPGTLFSGQDGALLNQNKQIPIPLPIPILPFRLDYILRAGKRNVLLRSN